MVGWKSIMYKVFLDINILLDYLIAEREGHSSAQRIIELSVDNKIISYISSITLINIFYILRKQRTESERKEIIESFLVILDIVELDVNLLQLSLYLPIEDYEDSVQYACAEKVDVDYIITGDLKFQKCDLELRRISSLEFLNEISNNNCIK
jgi:predicted nucleic acid-binding protein